MSGMRADHGKRRGAIVSTARYHVAQYRHGKFDGVMSGMGKNRGTLDAEHSRRAAQRHAQALRAEPWRAQAGLTYKVETTS